ncbi:hypothetical protein ACWEQG_36725 [Microbispora sp. NPDC004025]
MSPRERGEPGGNGAHVTAPAPRLLGALRVALAVLPGVRERGRGHAGLDTWWKWRSHSEPADG